MNRRRLVCVKAMLALAHTVVPLEVARSQIESDQAPVAGQQGLTLSQCLSLAESNGVQLGEARAKRAHAEAQLLEARLVPFGEASARAGIGLAPTVQGTPIYSPDTDQALSSNLALGWQVSLSTTLPLWTFGKLTAAREAAEAGVDLSKAELEKERSELRQLVKRAYYGVLFATDVQLLLDEAEQVLGKHVRRLEDELEEDEGDEVTFFKLQMSLADLEGRRYQAQAQRRIALSALGFLVGKGRNAEVQDVPLPEPPASLGPLTRYLAAARIHRPEINMARAGVRAREAQVRLERARFYPDVGLTVGADWRRAPEVTDQVNPFVNDPANFFRFNVAVGLQWRLDTLPRIAKVAQAQAKLEEVRATERYALGGIATEVEEAYEQARQAQARLGALVRAADYARKWLISIQQGIDIGAYEADDLVSPAREYATKRFEELTARYDFHVSLGRLAVATGWDPFKYD